MPESFIKWIIGLLMARLPQHYVHKRSVRGPLYTRVLGGWTLHWLHCCFYRAFSCVFTCIDSRLERANLHAPRLSHWWITA